MIANPADLLGPRSETPRSGERRDQVWGKYVQGEPTGARKSVDERVNTRHQQLMPQHEPRSLRSCRIKPSPS